jgi:hypothetical protein
MTAERVHRRVTVILALRSSMQAQLKLQAQWRAHNRALTFSRVFVVQVLHNAARTPRADSSQDRPGEIHPDTGSATSGTGRTARQPHGVP